MHSFFRQTYDTGFVCDGSWWVPPPDVTEWTSSCSNDARTSTRTGRVVGIEPYPIDGKTRQAIHVSWIDRLSRDSDGTVTTDVWIDQETGLMLKEHAVTDSRNDSVVGKVVFREQLDLTLRSLTPEALISAGSSRARRRHLTTRARLGRKRSVARNACATSGGIAS